MDMQNVSEPIFFSSPRVPIPLDAIYRRMGYRTGKTRLDQKQRDEIESYIEEALGLIAIQASALILPIERATSERVWLSRGVMLESRDLTKMLTGCKEALLMGTTAGKEIVEAIAVDSNGDNVTRAVVLDATASEVVDASLDWLMSYFRQSLMREMKTLTSRRFSAGYGDFLMENQKSIYSLLMLNRLGISLTHSHILIPEKSVTAVAGIREIG